jgi:hypothetical protein
MPPNGLIVDTALLPSNIEFSTVERDTLRGLAAEVADLLTLPIEAEKRELWRRHNKLEPTRPVIYCSPENAWTEIFPPDQLQCTQVVARDWELRLRQLIFYGRRMGDDYTIPPFFDIGHVHEDPFWGLAEQRVGGEHNSSYTWISPIKTFDDIDKLRMPMLRVDFAATQHLAALATDCFGDLYPVRVKTAGCAGGDPFPDPRLKSAWWWSTGMTLNLANLRGLQQMMVDMVDSPELIHRIMAILRDGTLFMLDKLESAGLLYLNNDATYVASGGLGWSDELPQADHTGVVRLSDLWGFGESQETVGISPRMFETFVFPYQLPILERFGLNCYGCCEPLDKRWRIIKQIPRLRRVSVSAWSDAAVMAKNVEDHCILSIKPSPTDLAMETFNEDRIRQSLHHYFEVTRGCHVEILMKDNHTIRNQPSRLTRWVELAHEEIDNVWK